MKIYFYWATVILLVLFQYVNSAAKANSTLVLYSLNSPQAPAHLSNVLLEAKFTFQEECGRSCSRASPNICVRRVGDLPKQLVPLAPYLNYTNGAKLHVHIHSGNWNAALWGEWWKRRNPPAHGGTGAGAMLEVSCPSQINGSTFAVIRHLFGQYIPGFSSSSGKESGSGDTENMPLTRHKPFRISNTTLMQFAREAQACTNNAKEWLAMVPERELPLLELLLLQVDGESRPLSWYAQSAFRSLSLDFTLRAEPTSTSTVHDVDQRQAALATTTLSLSAVLSPGRLASHALYVKKLRDRGVPVLEEEEEEGKMVFENDIGSSAPVCSRQEGCSAATASLPRRRPPRVTISRAVGDSHAGRLEIAMSVLNVERSRAVTVTVIEALDEAVLLPLYSQYTYYVTGQHDSSPGVGFVEGNPSRVADIPGFAWHPSPLPSSGTGSVVWTLTLQPGEELVSTLPCIVQHRHRDGHAADASRGVDVPPAVLSVCNMDAAAADHGRHNHDHDDGLCWTLGTEGYTARAPIPDFPMPFHVITLVSTALAFLVGSLINVVFRSGGRPKEGREKEGTTE